MKKYISISIILLMCLLIFLLLFNTKFFSSNEEQQLNVNVLSIDKIRTYTQVDPLEVYFYKDQNGVKRIKAPNLIEGTIDTPNIIYFEEINTNNEYDLEVYYDSQNNYYVITSYKQDNLIFLTDGKVTIPEKIIEENTEINISNELN